MFALVVALNVFSTTTAFGQTMDTDPRGPIKVASKQTSRNAMAASPVAEAPRTSSQPAWQSLTAAQQQSLKPLAPKWSSLSEIQKRKWIAIAQNYASLPPDEQVKLHNRMAGWVSLSPQQRAQARLNFAESKKLSASEKSSTWEAYQALSAEEKQKLAAKAKAQAKPTGVASTIRPAPAKKITVVPVTQEPSRPTPKIAISTKSLQHNTLLPQQAPAASPAPAQKN